MSGFCVSKLTSHFEPTKICFSQNNKKNHIFLFSNPYVLKNEYQT